MKKLFILICSLICLSCYKSVIDDKQSVQADHVDHFHSECVIGDIEYYGSYNINPRTDVEMYLVRREKCILAVVEYEIDGMVYTMNKDTVYIDKEIYHYKLGEFKNLLIKKNQLPRDTTIFKITNNMYCDWKTFDQMYTKYVY